MYKNKTQLINEIADKAKTMRKHAIKLTLGAGAPGAHIGPGLSIMEIVSTLYFGVMKIDPKNPDWPDRDRFLLSKGHAVLGLYPALAEAGFFSIEMLYTFEKKDSHLAGHPCAVGVPGIECSSGSLGHGLSFGLGIAMAAKINKKNYDTYVLLGDGEINEGMVWEAALVAGHFKMDNLIAIVDRNGLQLDGFCKEVMDMEPLTDKWKSFGWNVIDVDGHNIEQLLDAFDKERRVAGKPLAIIAKTIKGKGVSFIENRVEWHKAPISKEQAELALYEIEMGRAAK